jgi:hypothetical protein
MVQRWLVLVVLASLTLPVAGARGDVDLWPALVLSEDETVMLYPFYVRERQSARITSVEGGRVEILLGSEEEGARESLAPGEGFGGLSHSELVERGVGPLETPDFLMMFPWYYRTNHGRDHHVLWPLFKSSRGRVERAAPLWFQGENSFTLLPIIHRTSDLTLWAIPPTVLSRDGSMTAVFPLFLRRQHELYVAPTYYRTRRPGEPAVDALLPLWIHRRDAASSLVSLLVLFGWQRGPESEAEWAFPLFYDQRERERRRTGLLFPIYYREREPDSARTWLLPVFVERGSLVSRTWVVPFWLSTREHRERGEVRTWLSVLWPLYSREEVRSASGKLAERRRRFLVFADRLERDGRRTLSVFGIPIRESL